MPPFGFKGPRLFVDGILAVDTRVRLAEKQSHYVTRVLRLKDGDALLLFNGRDGEWRAQISRTSSKGLSARVLDQTRPQPPAGNLCYGFAPLKRARLDYLVQKATEMGVSALQPVITRRTQVRRLNMARIRANTIEAAQQCGLLSLPCLKASCDLETWLGERAGGARVLVFCDEALAGEGAPLRQLAGLRGRGIDVLVGPEGGFSSHERARLMQQPESVAIALGPRILRADTAAIAALTLVQACAGDWASPGRSGA